MPDDLRELTRNIVRKLGLMNSECCETCCNQDISVVQCYILHEISKLENPSMQQVAESLGIDITTFSRQVKSLVEKGLVHKTSLLEDRRVSILSLTEQGTETERQVNKYSRDYINQVFSHFTDFEKDTVVRSLKLLNKAMSGHCC
jgi:DNA-binding MarR family transcriptional regulator